MKVRDIFSSVKKKVIPITSKFQPSGVGKPLLVSNHKLVEIVPFVFSNSIDLTIENLIKSHQEL